MINAQTPGQVGIPALLQYLKDGRYQIPDFQREFEWAPWDIRDLMRSIFLDYFIGTLLLWKGSKKNFDALACEHIYGFQGQDSPEYIVLDGQQRLTAIYYAFMFPDVPLPNRANRAVFYINVKDFIEERYDEAFQYEWYSQPVKRFLANKEELYSSHYLPLFIIGQGGWDLGFWLQEYEAYWKSELDKLVEKLEGMSGDEDSKNKEFEDATKQKQILENFVNAIADFGLYMKQLIEQYQISYISLNEELSIDKICDIFTQVNSKGIRLDVFDLINAMLKPRGIQLKHMWRAVAPKLEFVETDKMNVYILQVMSIIEQGYCSPKYLYFLLPGTEKPIKDAEGKPSKQILITDKEEFETRWDYAVNAIESAIKLLRHPHEYGAISSNYLPYVSIIPAFSALNFAINELEDVKQLAAQRKLRKWYWASVFTSRYSGSVESTAARDYVDVKAWFEDEAALPVAVLEFEDRYKSLDLRKEVKRGSSIYNGMFNLLVLNGAKDWIKGTVPQAHDLDDHHIVPARWGNENLARNEIHTILNRTPLTSDTNRKVIRDRLPNEYLPELISHNGEEMVREILATHFISPEAQAILMRKPFGPEDYEDFIQVRQKTLQEGIENLLIKERLDLSIDLRELDQKVEQTELAMRSLIGNYVKNHSVQFPPHVEKKLEDRIQGHIRRNAALNLEEFSDIGKRLEFCDLRELQDIMISKSFWQLSHELFGTKEALIAKFNQLAELRNSIRHSRSVNEISRKEGEAALLWFGKILDV